MKTKSGRDIGVFFPTALLEAFVAFSKSSDKAINWHIRQACIEYLSRHGIDVSDLSNPEGRGARSDLKKHKATKVLSSERLEKLKGFKDKAKENQRFDM